jgi:predicted nucleic acid-binding protein
VEGRTDLLVSDLAVTEIVSALARRLREGGVSRDTARRVQYAVTRGLDGGVYQRVELTPDVYRRAEHLLLSLTDTPLRTADALHLALATSARATSIASFDGRLSAAARSVGFTAYPA